MHLRFFVFCKKPLPVGAKHVLDNMERDASVDLTYSNKDDTVDGYRSFISSTPDALNAFVVYDGFKSAQGKDCVTWYVMGEEGCVLSDIDSSSYLLREFVLGYSLIEELLEYIDEEASYVAAQQHYAIVHNGMTIGVMVHDWNEMPNIVNNILNAHWGHDRGNGRPALTGLISVTVNQNVGGGTQIVQNYNNNPMMFNNLNNPFMRSMNTAGSNRNVACGSSYCRERFLKDHVVGGRYDARRPPLFGTPFTMNTGRQLTVRLRDFSRQGFTTGPMAVAHGAQPPGQSVDLPNFFSCDEYPFASSNSGAAAARVNCVPDWEQDIQKTVTGNFYTGCTSLPPGTLTTVTGFGQPFYTAVINVPDVLYRLLGTGGVNGGIPDFCDTFPHPVRGVRGIIPTELSCI